METLSKTDMPEKYAPQNEAPAKKINLWKRFDKKVSNIGNVLDEETPAKNINVCVKLLTRIIVLCALICIVLVRIYVGFWPCIYTTLSAIAVGYILRHSGKFCIKSMAHGSRLGARLIFTNAWSLIASILFFGGIMAASFIYLPSLLTDKTEEVTTELLAEELEFDEDGTEYVSTVSRLNIREEPYLKSQIIGIVRPGQRVKVYERKGDFARISYNGSTAYAIFSFMDRID